MQVLRDRASIVALEDPTLRALIEKRVEALAEFDDCPLEALVTFIVVEPGDTLKAIDAVLGRSVVGGTHELIEAHAGFYEMVFVLSDDGAGIEVFIPKIPGVPPELLAMCADHAMPTQERPDS